MTVHNKTMMSPEMMRLAQEQFSRMSPEQMQGVCDIIEQPKFALSNPTITCGNLFKILQQFKGNLQVWTLQRYRFVQVQLERNTKIGLRVSWFFWENNLYKLSCFSVSLLR